MLRRSLWGAVAVLSSGAVAVLSPGAAAVPSFGAAVVFSPRAEVVFSPRAGAVLAPGALSSEGSAILPGSKRAASWLSEYWPGAVALAPSG